MTAIAARFNTEAPGEEILAFYNTAAAQLGFEPVDARAGKDVTANGADATSKGLIRNPSQVAVAYFGKLTRVYAIVDVNSQITLLSPGYKALNLATESAYGSLAACDDGARQGWLYYLRDNPYRIVEYDLVKLAKHDISIDGLVTRSYLAACYDPSNNKRHLFGQKSDRTIFRYSDGSTDVVKGSKAASGNTPIAVALNPAKTQIHIYFLTDDDMSIHRISWSDGVYSPATALDGPDHDPFTTIAAVPAEIGVHVFYIYQPDDTTRAITHYVDKWA